jgi:chloride channel 3/4/5
MSAGMPLETTPLLDPASAAQERDGHDIESLLSSHLSKDERALHETALGERLPYNDYTTIDWLHDMV